MIGVKAIQIATAYCAIANGGFLVKPILIKQIIDNQGNNFFKKSQSYIVGSLIMKQ